jgi:ABC-type transport system involved in multi-copper enzyme maturation permease subunit
MIRVVLAESRKLRRPTLVLSTLATVTALTGLFTSLVFLRAGSGHNSKRGETITPHELSQVTGLVYGFKLVSFFLGIVALCIFASQTAQEYTYGTLRNLLVRQPSRMKILLGKLISMKIFALVLVLFAGAISIAISYLLAGHAKVDTTAWSHGGHLLLQTVFNIFLATILYGMVGMILGLLLRSPISAISVGVIWMLILETILGASLPESSRWLPGQNISNIAEGGTIGISYLHSITISLLYVAVAGAIVAALFKRRDVAN